MIQDQLVLDNLAQILLLLDHMVLDIQEENSVKYAP